jgi:hypothetical protein
VSTPVALQRKDVLAQVRMVNPELSTDSGAIYNKV